jgi:hypothetical protein
MPRSLALAEWSVFQGLVLSVQFKSESAVSLDGSAVVVAPGIALAAYHVLADLMEQLMKGKMVVHCFGWVQWWEPLECQYRLYRRKYRPLYIGSEVRHRIAEGSHLSPSDNYDTIASDWRAASGRWVPRGAKVI